MFVPWLRIRAIFTPKVLSTYFLYTFCTLLLLSGYFLHTYFLEFKKAIFNLGLEPASAPGDLKRAGSATLVKYTCILS